MLVVSADKSNRMLYEARLKEWRDNKSRVDGAWAEGKLEGEAIGIEKGILQTARKMKAEGIGVDVISKVTGLPAKEVSGL